MNGLLSMAMGVTLLAATGCGGGGPYDVGLIVKSAAEVQSTTKSYREVSGKGVQESIGVVGSGSVCSDAMTSAGKTVEQWLGEEKVNFQVVGETLVPRLVPDDTHEQEEVWISLVMETTRSGGTVFTSTKTNDPEAEPAETLTETLEDRPITSDIRYFGVTAEEYVAAFELATLWPSDDGGLNPGDAEMLTKNNPRKGDVWFSQNGNSVYVYSAREDLTVSGQTLKVDKIEVYESADVEVVDDGIMDVCINTGRSQYANSAEGGNFDDEVTLLDDGCEDRYRHAQVGTQWWHKGILVKEETDNVDVTVTAYGWEWYEESEGYCYRETSTTRPNASAEMFIHYDVTTSTVTRKATDWLQGA